MCGIVGAITNYNVLAEVFEGLTILENRGYDSSGIAWLESGATLRCVRSLGVIDQLRQQMPTSAMSKVAIGHTRWATHGKPSVVNAHPHCSKDRFAVVHNGIIENYEPLREELQAAGYVFASQADSEVLAHLVHFEAQQEDGIVAVMQRVLQRIRGHYALVVLDAQNPHQLVAVSYQSPLVVARSHKGTFIASEQRAIAEYCDQIYHLVDHDMVVIGADKVTLYNESNTQLIKWLPLHAQAMAAELGDDKFHMIKEIKQQPDIMHQLFSEPPAYDAICDQGQLQYDEIVFAACGTSYHASSIAQYWLDAWDVPAHSQVQVASEFRLTRQQCQRRTLVVVISQSGETADTLQALKSAQKHGLDAMVITNVENSTMTRYGQHVVYTHAGVEIGVASTKTFTAQLAVLLQLVLALPHFQQHEEVSAYLPKLPEVMQAVIDQSATIRGFVQRILQSKQYLFIARGIGCYAANEAALKFQELTYFHAQAYPAGELKHGPLALIEDQVVVIAFLHHPQYQDRLLSNLNEIESRGGRVFLLCDDAITPPQRWKDHTLLLPHLPEMLTPFSFLVASQLMAYHAADLLGRDVDMPRNLAKAVTVE